MEQALMTPLFSLEARGFFQSLKLTAFIVLLGLLANWSLLYVAPHFTDEHGLLSAVLAFDSYYCHKISHLSYLGLDLTAILNLEIPRYCEHVSIPYQQNESGLRMLYEMVFSSFKTTSFPHVGVLFQVLRLILGATFIFFLTRWGFSRFVLFMVFSIFIFINYHVNISSSLSLYPFLLPFLLMYIIFLVVYIKNADTWSAVLFLSLILGVFGAFLKEFRSSYIVVFIATALFVGGFLFIRQSFQKALVTFFISLLLIVTNYQVFDQVINKKYEMENLTHNYTHHAIWHPLLLSLGFEESKIKEKYDLSWQDKIGERIAQEIDPTIQYNDSRYDEALKMFYLSLWQKHPFDMISIYIKRMFWQKAASSIRKPFKGLSFPNIIYVAPLTILNKIFFEYGGTAHLIFLSYAFLLWRNRKKMSLESFSVLMILLFATEVIMMESLIIHPTPSIRYYAVPTFTSFFLLILVLEAYKISMWNWARTQMKKTRHFKHRL